MAELRLFAGELRLQGGVAVRAEKSARKVPVIETGKSNTYLFGEINMKNVTVFAVIIFTLALVLIGTACSSGPEPTATNPIPGKVIKSAPIGNKNLTLTLSNDTGVLKKGEQEIMLSFTDAAGKAVDVGTVSAAALNFHMPAMGSMAAMNNAATFSTTSVPGVYKGKVNIEMAGDWQAQVSYEGVGGSGKTVIPITAR